MQSFLLKFGALVALAQTVTAGQLHIETTHPPANKYKSHCTVILEDDLFGCSGSSQPFPQGCGGNRGVKTAPICGDDKITVDWHSGLLTFQSGSGQKAHCTLDSTADFGKCDTNDPDKYPPPINSKASSVNPASVLYGLAPIAAGLLL